MARTIGVKQVYLMKDEQEVWEFVDDYRPASEYTLHGKKYMSSAIDRRYARYDAFGGLVWSRDDKEFNNAEEGNAFYLELLNKGFKPCTEREALRLRRHAADMTY